MEDCGRFWLSPEGADIDGWRLDVAHEVSPDFWREFAAACNDAKPDCALLGELMHGDYNTHVGPGLLDSGTNYQLSKALWSSLNDHNYWELQHSFQRDEDMYGNLTMLNFLGNHDQCRVHSRLTDARELVVLAAASLSDALAALDCRTDVEQCFVIGGGQVYKEAWHLERLSKVYRTLVHGSFECDAFIPADLPPSFERDPGSPCSGLHCLRAQTTCSVAGLTVWR